MGDSRISLKAVSADTDGAFFLSETVIAPGFAGPPLHVVCAPPGVPHTFSNPSSEPVRFLNFNVPGGFETYMRELAAAWIESGGAPDPAAIGEIASQHDFEVV
jgi:hypothetical protein